MSDIAIIKWANNLGITEPVNGSWIEAIARHLGEYGDKPHIVSIANSLGVTSPSNGSWIQAIAEHYNVDDSNLPWIVKIATKTAGGGGNPYGDDFVIRVKTDNAGTSATNQFTIPTSSGTYNYNITTDEHNLTNQTGSVTLTFSTPGEYDIRISIPEGGNFPTIFFNNGGDKAKLIYTYNFGAVGWSNLFRSFLGCSNNQIAPNATADFSNVINVQSTWQNNNLDVFPAIDFPSGTSFRGAWNGNNLTSFPLISMPSANGVDLAWGNNNLTSFPNIDLSNCTNFQGAWGTNNLTSFPLMDMSSATRVDSAWINNSLTTFPAIDFPNCTNFSSAWRNNNLTSFPLINVSSGTSFASAWLDNNLTSFPLLNMSSATNTSATWQNNSLTSFPAIDMPLTTTVRTAWVGNNLDTFPDIDLSSCLDMEASFQSNGIISSFSLRNFYSMTDGRNMLFGSTIPTSDWSDILVTQRANNVNTGLSFHGGSSTYNVAGGVARGELASIQLWNITDGGAA